VTGLGFYLIAGAMAGYSDVSILLAVGAYTLAGVIGVLAFVFPSGLGVREGVIVGVMGLTMSADAALAIAVVGRVVAVAADVAFVASVAAVDVALRIMRANRVRFGRDVAPLPLSQSE
jgi:uncharacterized membrane protein YbhN (UPF0104 family)